MSRPGRNRRGMRNQHWGMRDSNYLGAESLNWREPPPEHPPVKPIVSTVTPHQEYADFLHKGWSDFEFEKGIQGAQVIVHEEEKTLPRNPPINLEEWIKKHSPRD